MSTRIRSVTPAATVTEARTQMRLHGVHHLLVEDQGGFVGVVSDRDLGDGRGAGKAGTAEPIVAAVMTADPVTATPETTVRHAANLMRGRSIGCLPVLEGRRPVGIVTRTDLLELIGRGAERSVERSRRWTLRSRGVRGASPSDRAFRGV